MKKFLFSVFYFLLVIHSAFSQIAVLYNHLGFEQKGPKHIVFKGTSIDSLHSFQIIEYHKKTVVHTGPVKFQGQVDQWRDWVFWTADFSEFTKDGTYAIRYISNNRTIESFPFLITENLLEKKTLSDVVYYFKGQRCTGLLDKADKKMTFSLNTNQTVDVSGGWYDATGDYGKDLSHLSFSTYFNPQQTSLTAWALFASYEKLKSRNDPNFRQYLRRILDEAMYGADYLVRVHVENESFYRTISAPGPEKKAEDRRITPVMKGFKIKKEKPKDGTENKDQLHGYGENYQVSYRAGGGLAIAALAKASQYAVSGEFTQQQYLKSATEAFAFLESNNTTLTNDGIENIVDEYCALMAATALFEATQNEKYREAAKKKAQNLLSRQIKHKQYGYYWRADGKTRPFFHAADAGLPVVSLLVYYPIANQEEQLKIKETVENSLRSEMQVTNAVINPFGYARQITWTKKKGLNSRFFFPHDTETAPWWQGENARLSSLATAAKMAIPLFEGEKEFQNELKAYSQNQIDWVLGKNPFDACMMQGKGRNNVQYLFFESYEYSAAPGGICNGITAGLYNENDIDFNRGYLETGEDNDWRWAEQWLPHATWYLLAISN